MNEKLHKALSGCSVEPNSTHFSTRIDLLEQFWFLNACFCLGGIILQTPKISLKKAILSVLGGIVPGKGIEPSRGRPRWILSPVRLPIPPSGQFQKTKIEVQR